MLRKGVVETKFRRVLSTISCHFDLTLGLELNDYFKSFNELSDASVSRLFSPQKLAYIITRTTLHYLLFCRS